MADSSIGATCAPTNPKTSRRAILGAMALAPVAALPAAAIVPTTASAWAYAKRDFEAALAGEAAYDKAIWGPAYQAWANTKVGIPDDVDAEMERLVDIRCNCEDALIATPAPDLSQVIWKIEYARKRWEESVDWPDDWWAAVMADLVRLNGGAA